MALMNINPMPGHWKIVPIMTEPANRTAKADADHGNDRDQGVFQDMAHNDNDFSQPFRQRSADVVVVDDLEDTRTGVAHKDRRAHQGQHGGRQNDVPQIIGP